MKLKFLLSICALMLISGCARNEARVMHCVNGECSSQKMNVTGVYKATLPCADCAGIDATLTLNSDNTYTYTMIYNTKDKEKDAQKGSYEIKSDIITTTNLYKEQQYFKFDNSQIKLLDSDKQEIAGEIGKAYIFTKVK